MIGWDHPKTAHYYEEFCRKHERYAAASRELVGKARILPGSDVLDLAAGTGETLRAILRELGASGTVACVEPAEAMRMRGLSRGADPRVTWRADLPERERFDRILCSAALWQMLPLDQTFRRLRLLLRPEGLLCFNIPSQYLGEPDEPGGGDDPWLLGLIARLAAGRVSTAPAAEPLPTAAQIDRLLVDAGFRSERWTIRTRLTQAAYRDWLKIPVLTEWLLGDLDPDARAELIDLAFREVDAASWRWEKWEVWAAA